MEYALFYFDEVELDIQLARRWYKAVNEKLERRFVNAIESVILKLQRHPKAYGIHFYIDDLQNRIVIIAIVHGRRNPDFAKNRL